MSRPEYGLGLKIGNIKVMGYGSNGTLGNTKLQAPKPMKPPGCKGASDNALERIQHSCVKCGKKFAHAAIFFCDQCDGFVDVDYDLSRVDIREHENPLMRYFDLLPIANPQNLLWVDCGNTPCVHAAELGKALGIRRLYLKDETLNPTWTTKDRMASVVLSFFNEIGVREFVTSSTGNSSTSLAAGVIKYPFFTLHLFVAADFLDRLNFRRAPNIKVYSLEGATFVEAFAEAGKFAAKNGILSERGFFNPARREGLKLAFLEAVDQMPVPPDWYFQAVSSAMGVYGAYKGAMQYVSLGRLKKVPKFCCVQQDLCSPMVNAWQEHSPVIRPHHIVHKPAGIARAILRGNPTRTYPYAYNIVKQCGGAFVLVTQDEIRQARTMIWELEGIPACANSACTIAALKKMLAAGSIDKEEVVLINITGRERDDTHLSLSPADVTVWPEDRWRRSSAQPESDALGRR